MKIKKNSVQNGRATWIFNGLALVMMMLFLMGVPAYGQYSLTSSTPITINDDAVLGGEAANGYPSSVAVPTAPVGITGNIERVTVSVNGFTHGYPNDVVLLLVGPSATAGVSNAVFLMGNDGDGTPITAPVSLTFDDVNNGGSLSTTTPITTGTYHSGNSSALTALPGLAATANLVYQPSLSAFANLTPAQYAGTWSLYVLDDSQPNTGAITSWALNLFAQPAVAVTNTTVTFAENTTAAPTSTNFYFTVTDAASNATLTASITLGTVNEQNQGFLSTPFITTSDFTFSPSNPSPDGTNTLTITPAPYLYGNTTFTINVKDTNGVTVSSQLVTLTVVPVPQTPQIILPVSTVTTVNEVATTTNIISLVSISGNGGGNMQFSVLATNGAGAGGVNLVNVGVNSNVFTSTAGLPASTPAISGNTNSFYFSIVPGAFPVGTSYLNFIATDSGQSVTQAVTVIVQPLTSGSLAGPLIYTNPAPINLAPGAFQPFPITVPNLTGIGAVGKVTVSLLGLSNDIPANLSVGLTAPNGTTVVPLVSSSGSGSASTYAELTFADSAGTLNVQGSLLGGAGTVLTNYTLNASGGGAAIATTLAGAAPNGTWTLWVTNNTLGVVPLGISGGWVLDIYAAPLIAGPAASSSVTMTEAFSTNLVFITSDTIGTPSSVAVALNPTTTMNFSNTALVNWKVQSSGFTATVGGTTYIGGTTLVNGTNYTTNIVTVTGNPNETGTATLTLTVTDTNGPAKVAPSVFAANNNVSLNVTFVAQSPSISFIPNQVTYAGDAVLNVPFTISSPDVNANTLLVSVTSDNPELLPSSSAVVTPGSGSLTPPNTIPNGSPSVLTDLLSLFPVGVKGGSANVTVSVTDGVSNPSSTTFLLFVQGPGAPLYYNASPITFGAEDALGSLYPSPTVPTPVSGLVGLVENVVVTIYDVSYVNADGLNLLLVGPASASGQSPTVILMGDSGAGQTLTSANLVFSNSLAGPLVGTSLPEGSTPAINSAQIYIPTDYNMSAYTTAAPAPAPGPTNALGAPLAYGSDLVTSFSGISPLGNWSLYAYDSSGSPGKPGSILGGWEISIITAPNVTPSQGSYSTKENVPFTFDVPVGDAEPENTSLSVTATVASSGLSTGPATITIGNAGNLPITQIGAANEAVLVVNPVPYQFGTNTITITASDGHAAPSVSTVQVIVTFNAQPPVVQGPVATPTSGAATLNSTPSTPAAIPLTGATAVQFSVWDPQTPSPGPGSFNISAGTQGSSLIPDSNITITYSNTVAGTNNYVMTIQPAGVGTGTVPLTVTVIDGANPPQTTKVPFTVTVTPNLAFMSTAPINLGPGAPVPDSTSPYPSQIPVTGVNGTVSGVQVELLDFTHNAPEDIDVLLVSPDGTHSVVLMAGAGGQTAVNGINLEFSGASLSPGPGTNHLSFPGPLASGGYVPDNYVGSTLVFSNAVPPNTNPPTPPLNPQTMAAFNGVAPDGDWSLYVIDTGYPDSGSLGSWILFLQTGPAIQSIANQTVLETNPITSINVPLTLLDSSTPLSGLTVSVANTTTGGPPLTGSSTPIAVTVQTGASPLGVTNLVITPQLNYPSAGDTLNVLPPNNATNTLKVTVSDGVNSSSTSFNVVVVYSNQPPVVTSSAGMSGLTINENSTVPGGTGATSGSITFTVSDVDSYLSDKNITINSGNTAILADAGIVKNVDDIGTSLALGPQTAPTGTISYTITPVANTFGTGSIIFSISDTNNNTTTLTVPLTVTHLVQPPSITLPAALVSGPPYAVLPGVPSSNIVYTVSTVEPSATLTVTAVSTSASNPNPFPNSPNNIIITQPAPSKGTIQLVPVGAFSSSETSTIAVTVTQTVPGFATLTSSESFTMELTASPATVFANANPIGNTLGNRVPALYPSQISDPGLVGEVANVTVQLNAFSATDPEDVSVLLEAPNGAAVLLMSGAGGTNAASDLTLTFADSGGLASPTAPLAANGGSATYAPSSYPASSLTTALPTNAPAPPYFDQMAAFKGINPNGVWQLWVVDKTTGDTEGIADGWTLTITTGPAIATNNPGILNEGSPPPSTMVISEDNPGVTAPPAGAISFNVQDSTGSAASDVVTATGSPSSLFSSITVGTGSVSGNPPVDNYTATITQAPLASGSGTVTFTVTRSDGATDSLIVPVTVTKINIAPTVTRLGNISANENSVNVPTEFFVTEPGGGAIVNGIQFGDPLSGVWVAATSDNPAVLPNKNISFATGSSAAAPGTVFGTNFVNLGADGFASQTVANAGDVVLQMTPLPNVIGVAHVTVYATNIDSVPGPSGTNTTTAPAFTFTVTTELFKPTFTNVPASVTLNAGSTINVSIGVNSLDTPLPEVTVTASSSATSAVTVGSPVAVGGMGNMGVAGSVWMVPITALPTTTPGKASTITLSATDANSQSATPATIQVFVVPNQGLQYSNPFEINIVDVSPAVPSPSEITVPGLVGLISQVVVTVNNFGHQYPSDVGILLVGPGSSGSESNTVLMNNAGFATPVTGLTLTFSNTAPAAPQNGGLSSTIYAPSDYHTPKPYNFELSGPGNEGPLSPPPPSGPYGADLSVFNGANPGGSPWYLYVQDDSPGDVGEITNGWSLTIVTRPQISISGASSLTVPETLQFSENTGGGGITGKTGFTILEDSTFAATNYTSNSFSVTSTNGALIPASSVVFTGSSTNWTAGFTATLNSIGTDLITIFATNSYNQVASNSFIVQITPVFVQPSITAPATGSTVTVPAGSVTAIPLAYSDEGFNANALIVSATTPGGPSSPISSLSFSEGVGNGPSNLVVTTVGNTTGSATVTLIVSQPVGNPLSATNTFTVTVVPSTVPLYYQPAAITINNDTVSNGEATPYPSTINVSGLENAYKVTATLIGFSHTFPANVSALLVGPQGQSVVLMSDEGNLVAASDLRLTFDDAGGAMSATGPLTSGTYAPALSDLLFVDSQPDVTFPQNPTPPPTLSTPYGHSLSVFSNTNPNGQWSLFVYDNAKPDVGVISGGWLLSIETIAPEISQIGQVAINENTTTNIPFTVGSASTPVSDVVVTATASAEAPPNLVSSLIITGAGTANQTLSISPTLNYPSAVPNFVGNGQATITLVLSNTVNNTTTTNSFQLIVLRTDLAPIINLPVAATNTPANVTLAVPFTVTDVDGTSNLTVTASLAPNIGTVGVTSNGSGNYTLTFTPDGATTTATASIVAGDGVVSTTNTLQITVTAGLAPAVNVVAATNTPENSSLTLPLTLANVTPTFSASSITAVASNPNLVTSVVVKGAGSNFTASITLAPYALGSSTITFTANDQYGTGTNTTALTVTFVEYPPTLGVINAQSTPANTPVNVVLNVTDVATSITNLIYGANISNTNLIAAVNFSFNGTAEVATIVPAANKVGVEAVTITVGDGVTNVSQAFAVSVTAPTPPVLGPIPSQTTVENNPVEVGLSVTSPVTPVTNLVFTGTSTSPTLVKSIGFAFNGTTEVATITPVTGATGSATVTISVSDPFSTNSESFGLQVNLPTPPTLTAGVTSGVLEIQFTGVPGASYTIQSSSDLINWRGVATITANAVTGAGEYQAAVVHGTPGLFYRVAGQ